MSSSHEIATLGAKMISIPSRSLKRLGAPFLFWRGLLRIENLSVWAGLGVTIGSTACVVSTSKYNPKAQHLFMGLVELSRLPKLTWQKKSTTMNLLLPEERSIFTQAHPTSWRFIIVWVMPCRISPMSQTNLASSCRIGEPGILIQPYFEHLEDIVTDMLNGRDEYADLLLGSKLADARHLYFLQGSCFHDATSPRNLPSLISGGCPWMKMTTNPVFFLVGNRMDRTTAWYDGVRDLPLPVDTMHS